MPKKNRISELKIGSIGYVHDPESAKKWMNIYVDLLKSQLLNETRGETNIEE